MVMPENSFMNRKKYRLAFAAYAMSVIFGVGCETSSRPEDIRATVTAPGGVAGTANDARATLDYWLGIQRAFIRARNSNATDEPLGDFNGWVVEVKSAADDIVKLSVTDVDTDLLRLSMKLVAELNDLFGVMQGQYNPKANLVIDIAISYDEFEALRERLNQRYSMKFPPLMSDLDISTRER